MTYRARPDWGVGTVRWVRDDRYFVLFADENYQGEFGLGELEPVVVPDTPERAAA